MYMFVYMFLFLCLCLSLCLTVSVCLCLCPPFRCLSSPLFGLQMEQQQNVPQPHGTTWWNHSCYTGIRLSALHCLRQLQPGASSALTTQLLSLTQESNGTAPFRSRAQPAAATQFHYLTLSGGPHSRCPHTDGATVLCAFNTPSYHSRRLYATLHLGVLAVVFLLNTPSGAQFYFAVKHRPPAVQATRCQPRSTMPPRSSPLPSSSSVASTPELSRHVPRLSSTLLLDAATGTSPHSAASADATTQLRFTEFFLGCVCSKDPLDRAVPPPTQGYVSGASLLQPSDTATTKVPAAPAAVDTSAPRSHACGSTVHQCCHQASKDRHSWEFHTTSLRIKPPCAPHMGYL